MERLGGPQSRPWSAAGVAGRVAALPLVHAVAVRAGRRAGPRARAPASGASSASRCRRVAGTWRSRRARTGRNGGGSRSRGRSRPRSRAAGRRGPTCPVCTFSFPKWAYMLRYPLPSSITTTSGSSDQMCLRSSRRKYGPRLPTQPMSLSKCRPAAITVPSWVAMIRSPQKVAMSMPSWNRSPSKRNEPHGVGPNGSVRRGCAIGHTYPVRDSTGGAPAGGGGIRGASASSIGPFRYVRARVADRDGCGRPRRGGGSGRGGCDDRRRLRARHGTRPDLVRHDVEDGTMRARRGQQEHEGNGARCPDQGDARGVERSTTRRREMLTRHRRSVPQPDGSPQPGHPWGRRRLGMMAPATRP